MPADKRFRDSLELLQGTLDLMILETLRAWGPQHGYGLSQLIRTNSGNRLTVDAGSIYPAVHRLERRRLLAGEWQRSENNQRTRVYSLTSAGRKQLSAERSRWDELVRAMAGILEPPPKES
jgi:transcriptional regulator